MNRLEVEGFFGAPRCSNVEARPGERRGHEIPDRSLIIDYQDSPLSHKHDIIVTYCQFVT